MPYKECLQKAKALRKELDNYRPLTPEMEDRIMRKFRLDWNFHSSNIEGNSLTYGETKALILFGQTAQAKPLKDHLEMSGHDEAIKNIEEVVRQKRTLTENFIRELHKLILKNPYEVDAITPDGKPTKKKISIGSYKTTPNHVKTPTGEIFYFASPEETPAKMDDLMKWYRQEIDKKDLDVVLFATEFHYRFIRIHPFDDGNGRIARLLMNFILMQKGYPPAIIKTKDKQNYFNALQQADAGNIEYFFKYICEREVESLELMISGAKGEEIEEEDDLDKKIKLLKQKLGREPNDTIKTRKSSKHILNIINESVLPLLEELERTSVKFDSFFKERTVYVKIDSHQENGRSYTNVIKKLMEHSFYKDALKKPPFKKIVLQSRYKDLRSLRQNNSINGINLTIQFLDLVYEFVGTGLKRPFNKLYHQQLKEEEIKQIALQAGNELYRRLESFINKQGNTQTNKK